MKYVLLLTRGAWQEEGTEAERAEVFGDIMQWRPRSPFRTAESRCARLSSAEERAAGARSLLERVFREEACRLTASLIRLLGDFDLAEEMVSAAVVEALKRWPTEGPPRRPGAWLLTCARNKAIDRIRREGRLRDKLAQIAALPTLVERRAGRPHAPDLHVLPSGAGSCRHGSR